MFVLNGFKSCCKILLYFVKLGIKVWLTILTGLGCLGIVCGLQATETALSPSQSQMDDYQAERPKTILELQPFRRTSTINISDSSGQKGSATLINLNPRINSWYLLFIKWNASETINMFHLENPFPENQTILLDPDFPAGLSIFDENGLNHCSLWQNQENMTISKAAMSGKSFAFLCNDRVMLRNKTIGHKTTLEKMTDLLRTRVWQGEKITGFVRDTLYQDAYLDTSDLVKAKTLDAGKKPRPFGAPARPLVSARYENDFLIPHELGIEIETETGNRLLAGRWYVARNHPGIFVSVIQPDLVAEKVVANQQKKINPLDDVEKHALVYLVAFDLDRFDMGFELGTEHPKVNWSDRVNEKMHDPALPGPDGIESVSPVIRTGMVNPIDIKRLEATFIGGFKRYHGAFKYSNLALKNHGSHYGFVEHGTVLSKLLPGLATVVVYDDGLVDLTTWRETDARNLPTIRHARQNGVPIIEYEQKQNISSVGAFVPNWGQGNWSGSADKRFRTVRAGLGLLEDEGRRFLIYGYFSAATPSAMARVFEAYQVKYAMLLDINALEHTYLAIYNHQGDDLTVENLIKGMHVLDQKKEDRIIPRFVGYADNRDFFYLTRKPEP